LSDFPTVTKASDYGWRLSPTCTTMAQPPSFPVRFGGCFFLLAGSRRPAGADRAGAWAAGEMVQQIGPGPVKLPGPVLVLVKGWK